jgi:squalene-hopene/tetraprenyl-beta-curcumene cyclase
MCVGPSIPAAGLCLLLAAGGSARAAEIPVVPEGPTASAVAAALEAGRRNVLEQRLDGEYWNLPSYLGTHYLSQYYLLLRWLGRDQTRLDPARLQRMLLETQLPDGSWHAIRDASVAEGDLNATILDYWALKAMGLPADSEPLSRARAFILARGGLGRASAFTRLVCALFGNHSWEFMPQVPFALFNVNLPFSQDDFAQWVGPHLLPIAYLRAVRPTRDLGPDFRLDELWVDPEALAAQRRLVERSGRETPGGGERRLIRFILGRQQPRGSFGAYTVSTLLSAVAFDDFARFHPEMKPRLDEASAKGFGFVEWMYFDSGPSAYLGVLDDGRYWDTALLGIALQEAGVAPEQLRPTAEYLVRHQCSNGGFAFGEDFWYAADTDDTAEILLFLARHREVPGLDHAAWRAVRWLESMQNSDGGWGAFARDNDGNWLLSTMAEDLLDSADLFDESSPDVTGHILEALAAYGRGPATSKTARRAIDYLKRTQEPSGAWWARWGVNYLYGTGAAVVGLVRAGESPRSPWLARALDWIESRQQPDGSFGESTRSYLDPAHAGVGTSTPSQTAWSLLALVEGGRADGPAARRAAGWLVAEIERDGRWIDRSTVGTGHPRIIYMNYPSYPYSFPLTALARWAKAVGLTAGTPIGLAGPEVGQAQPARDPPAQQLR